MSDIRAALIALACIHLDLKAIGLTPNEACDMEEQGVDIWELAPRFYDNSKIAELVLRAPQDEVAFEALIFVATRAMHLGDPTPPAMRAWAHDVMTGKAKPSKKPGQAKSKNIVRDLGICIEIHRLKAEGIDVYRNRQLSGGLHGKKSASEIVGDRHNRSPAAIEAVWEKYAHMR